MNLYVRELPQRERDMLCACLDANNQWKELGVRFGFDDVNIKRIEKLASYSPMKSPTNYLLTEWETQRGGKILTLFGYLDLMNNYRAMKILKPFVDPRFHRFINEAKSYCSGNDNHSPLNASNSRNRNSRPNPTELVAAAQPHSGKSRFDYGEIPTTSGASLTQSSPVCSFHIPYKELQQGTNNWSESLVLGKGGFGKVFKGTWKNTDVAIKRLEPKRPNDSCNSLKKELKFLTKYRHDNVLPLYGYSIDEEKPCLVYQLMSNGSLEDQLQLRRNVRALSWWARATIAKGSARGLQFLHSVDNALIHGDIKSANILLDSNFVPKVGDFGLARDGPIKNFTHIDLTTVCGTHFYIPVEVLRGKRLSVKADTYAFGVVLCELATGSEAGFLREDKSIFHLRDACHNAAAENCLQELKDLKAGNKDEEFYEDLIKLGIKCTNKNARERPLMADVLKELEIIVKLRVRKPTLPSIPETIYI